MTRFAKLYRMMMHTAVVVFGIAHSAMSETLIIRANANDFPSTYQKANQWKGMDIELLEEVLQRADLDYRIISMPFPRSILEVQDGSVQLVPNLVKNKNRSKYLHWLGPVRTTCIGLMVQKKDLNLLIDTTDDLIRIASEQNTKVGYLSGASYSAYFDHRLKTDSALNEILHFLPDNDQHRKMLQLGRLLGYFHDAFEIRQRLKDPEFAKRYQGLALHSYRIERSCNGAYIGISKQLKASTVDKLKTAFQSIKDDGTFSEIHHKWMDSTPAF